MAEKRSPEAVDLCNLGENWSSTDFPVLKVSHRWIIHKFRVLATSPGDHLKLTSTPFSGGCTEWHLELGRKCVPNSLVRYIQIVLSLDKAAIRPPMMVQYQLSIVSKHPESQRKQTDVYSVGSIPWKVELSLAEQKDVIVDEDLTVLCELTLSLISETRTVPYLPDAIEDSLTSDLGALLQDTELSDITLVVGAKEFPAHRIILAARSPVFKAMFEHDMREKTESRLDIPDLSADTVQWMLQWIYTGRLPSTEQESKDLLCASDKYSLEPLKVACERSLCRSLRVSNAVDLWELADLHHADYLKANSMRVIAANSDEVKATDRWMQLNRERVDLVAELSKRLLKF